jgi:iron(III) transport system permease protein
VNRVVSTLTLALLAGGPLVGLVFGLLWPPDDPWGLPPTPWLEQLQDATPAMVLSLSLALVVASLATIVGGAIAWWVGRTNAPGRRWIQVATLLPLGMPSYVLAASLAVELGPAGDLYGLGLPDRGVVPSALVLVLITAPIAQLIVGVALTKVSAAEIEAARSLGASRWRVLRSVVWPRLRASIGFAFLLSALYALSDFGAVAVFDCPVLTWSLYQAVRGQALAEAVILGGATLLAATPLFALAWAVRGSSRVGGVANPRPAPRWSWRPVDALGLMLSSGFVVGLGLCVPVITLLNWVVSGLSQGEVFASPWTATWQTLAVAVAGASLTWCVAWSPAIRSARGHRGTEWVVYGVSALPAILLAFGWILTARHVGGVSGYAWWVGSGVLLAMSYAARFISEVHAPLDAGLRRIDPRWRDVGRTLGATRWAMTRRVWFPALSPAMRVAWLLGFLAIVKELPMTLLLGPMGMRTLAFRVWDRYEEAMWHDVGLHALILLVIALGGVVWTLRMESRVQHQGSLA